MIQLPGVLQGINIQTVQSLLDANPRIPITRFPYETIFKNEVLREISKSNT